MSKKLGLLFLCVVSLILIQCKQPEQPKIQGNGGTNLGGSKIAGGSPLSNAATAQINTELSQNSQANGSNVLPAPQNNANTSNPLGDLLAGLSGGGGTNTSGTGLFSGGLLGGLFGGLFSGVKNSSSYANDGNCQNCNGSVNGGCNCQNCGGGSGGGGSDGFVNGGCQGCAGGCGF